MRETGEVPAGTCAAEQADAEHTAVISECSPLQWRATLDGQPVDGVFISVEEAAAAIAEAMRERYDLIPADSRPLGSQADERERDGGEK